MLEIIPYHESGLSRSTGILDEPRRLAEEHLMHTTARDWHLAHLEDRERSVTPITRLGKLAARIAAENDLSDKADASHHDKRAHNLEPKLEVHLTEYRHRLGAWDKDRRRHADNLLRQHGLPTALIDASDTQMDTQGEDNNLISWMTHRPTDEEPYGATDAELAEVLRWGGRYATAIAKNPELQTKIMERAKRYAVGVKAAVASGKLSRGWLRKKPPIRNFVVSNMLDSTYLPSGSSRGASAAHASETQEIHIYPYTEDDDTEELVVQSHETNHSIGHFKSTWLNEAFTERYALLVTGANPDDDENHRHYPEFLRLLTHLYEGSAGRLTDAATSECYIGRSAVRNEKRLRAVVKRAYDGLDVIGTLQRLEKSLSLYGDSDGKKLTTLEVRDRLEFSMATISRLNTGYRLKGDTEGLRAVLQESREKGQKGDTPDTTMRRMIMELFESDKRLARKGSGQFRSSSRE